MTADAAPAQRTAGLPLRHIAAVTAGNALEFYDFLTYAFFAAQIGRTFFPAKDAAASLLAALATFGAGFLMRPVGALVIGRIGDVRGRKPAMLLTFGIMGAAMAGLALTPSYARIGAAAPILAILFRLAQGFAVGGEVGPNTAYLVEAAPADRRGLYVSMQFMSQKLAVLGSGLAGFALASHMSDAALADWGWRIAFAAGALIVPFGLAMRGRLAETLGAPEPPADATLASVPRSPRLRTMALFGLVLLAGNTIATYTLNYLTTYATATLKMPTAIGFLAPITTGLAGMVCDPMGGWLSDRFGRKPVMIAMWGAALVITLPAFEVLAATRSAAALIGAGVAMQACVAMACSSALVAITEGLPRERRSGALALIYAFAISVFGGTTQFVVAFLTKVTHSPIAPAWYMTGAVGLSLIAMILLPESAPRRLALRSSR